jgi:hypothetical protein
MFVNNNATVFRNLKNNEMNDTRKGEATVKQILKAQCDQTRPLLRYCSGEQ